jgi:hypothetical protein
MKPRPLSHDERTAAEAAYRGEPINHAWAASAQHIYHRMYSAKHGSTVSPTVAPSTTVTPSDNQETTPITPLTARPVQAWYIHLTDLNDHAVMLFPAHLRVTSLVDIVKSLNPDRPFTIQPLKQGLFAITREDLPLLQQTSVYDIRKIRHDGAITITRNDNPPPSASSNL